LRQLGPAHVSVIGWKQDDTMGFEKVDTQVDFPAQERQILEFWARTGAFERLREKNRGKPRWSFLDGPITANNPMGVHHAWGRMYKDAFQRYFAMTGHELRYQNGFDCQGLWVEVEVERELGVRTKRDIEDLVPGDGFASIDQFVRLCKERVDRFARVQTNQSIRLGYWMDWDRDEDWSRPPDERRSYFTMSEENNYTIWAFLKKCHDRDLIYRGYDAMPWCPRCGVGLSQMEVHEGYRRVAHRSIFVGFPLRGRPGESLLVWTTTPWTLSSNVAAAVNPGLVYVKVKHRDRVYYLAKGALSAKRLEDEFRRKEWVEGVPKLKSLEQIFREKGGFEVVGEIAGADMIGWAYDGPFDELPAQAAPGGFPREVAEVAIRRGWAEARPARDVHRVIAWDAVGETEGTGIVHIAPGCGKEDFQLGREQKLPPVSPLHEDGSFLAGTGALEGRSAIDPETADWIFDNLRQKDLLLAIEQYPHTYPHCWRCKTELLFRLVDEWFINMGWREEIMRVCPDAQWIPDFGLQRELDWLKNMSDWMISKKRFWGLALPIWVCEGCGAFEVIGGREDLKRRAVSGWEQFEGHTPHRPWIDKVKVRCTKCDGVASRIPDVGNPWLDAGIVPFSTLRWRHDPSYWEHWFPADFVVESFPGQFRNWFYSLLSMSAMLAGRAPFRTLLGHALVRDQWGRAMHKSEGNSIPFEGVADDGYVITNPNGAVEKLPPVGADVIRWVFARHNPANNVNFGAGPADEVRNKVVLKLWNTYAFFCNYARLDGFDPLEPATPYAERTDLDRWILSDLQLLIGLARRSFESFDLASFCLACERFIDERLSNWYVRRNRRRFWKSEAGPDKLAAYQTIYTVLVTLSKLVAPVMPFLAEVLYQNLVHSAAEGVNAEPSVHHCDYPAPDESLIDRELSADMDALLRLVSLGASARNNLKIKVRQPLAELKVMPAGDVERRAALRFADQIREELNVKRVTLHDAASGPLLARELKSNQKAMGPKFGPRLKVIQKALAESDPEAIAAALDGAGSFSLSLPDGDPVILTPEDVTVSLNAPQGWTGVADRGTQLALDGRITPELADEGMGREAVRHIQELRKTARLEMEDRIELYLGTESAALRKALDAHRDYICAETLTTNCTTEPLSGDSSAATVKVDGQALVIELRRAIVTQKQS
jgi:isoleucyl-tRNA synthetase